MDKNDVIPENQKLNLLTITDATKKISYDCILEHGPIPKNVLVLKIRSHLEEQGVFPDNWTVIAAIDLLAYEGDLAIEEGSHAKQYVLCPKLKGSKHKTI